MDLFWKYAEGLFSLVPTILAVTGVVLSLFAVRYFLERRYGTALGHQFRVQLAMLVLSFVGLLVVILALPVSETTAGQLLSLVGLLLTAVIALSSTTFVGNIMAGLMLRAVRAFRPGDHVRVGEHFGRISELGLFHVEIQTEDRDLTTMPNIYLVNNPFKVIRSSGTFVSTQVSLGYDVHHARVKQALILAAEDTGLQECFVHILELGDFSVTYKVSGLLTDTKKILTVGSRLKRRVLDQLHEVGIEIVSPNFMNQRILAEAQRMIPAVGPTPKLDPDEATPEATVFDKAEAAESLEELRVKYTLLRTQLEEKKVRLSTAEADSEKSALTQEIESDEKRLSRLAEFLKNSET